jgi:hypothetical protein
MKMVKSLILGSAAGLIAMSGAQAADLPVKAKAVEYVRICSLYGAGFFYIPGTDTCIKLGGYLRVDLAANTNSVYGGAYNGASGARNRYTNYYTARSRQDLTIDTRTATEYGVVRTFFDATFTWTSGGVAGAAGGTAYAGDGVAGGTLGVYHAFIQFAGFTMGKTISPFSAPWVNYPANNFDGLVGGGGSVTGVNQLTYTAQFGNGVSASFTAQDSTGYFQAGNVNTTLPGVTAANPLATVVGTAFGSTPYGVNATGGTRAPDLVGVLKVDQAWGIFQLSAAAHENHAGYYGATEPTGHPDDKWGFAVAGALQIKNIPTGAGDTINLQAVYTDGASRYNFQDLVPTTFAMYGGTSLAGGYQSLGFAQVTDSVYGAGTSQQLTQTWGFRGGFNHNWDPYWSSGLYGAYAQVKYNDTAKALICTNIVAVAVAGTGFSCNPDFNIAQIGLITRWTPVKNLTFSADVTYTRLDQKHSGGVAIPAIAATAKPAAVYELKDQDTVSMLFRAQRNF